MSPPEQAGAPRAGVAGILSPSDVLVGLRAAGKQPLLELLSRRAGTALGIDAAPVLAALVRREDLGSTGVGGGIALPHARLDAVARPFGLVAQLRDPIAYEAVDDLPVDLVFLLLLPAAAPGEHLDTLACVARRLREPATAAAMRAARGAAALFALACDERPADG